MQKIMFNDRFLLTKAVLEGRKTQTRRIITTPGTFRGQDVNGYYVYRNADGIITEICMKDYDDFPIDEGQILPKYKLGEVVAVAQPYCAITDDLRVHQCLMLSVTQGWRNKMFVKPELMPHQILITGIRVERLQDISDEDCLKEGVMKWDAGQTDIPFYSYGNAEKPDFDTPREAYAALIDKVSGKGTWESKPYVFVYDFELVK